jgi:hypothetical protein
MSSCGSCSSYGVGHSGAYKQMRAAISVFPESAGCLQRILLPREL